MRAQLPIAVPLFSSPLLRCAEMAAMLDAAYVRDNRLQELNFGAWEMQSWDDIGAQALAAIKAAARAACGTGCAG